MRNYTVT